jgi:hypothetical protein
MKETKPPEPDKPINHKEVATDIQKLQLRIKKICDERIINLRAPPTKDQGAK